MILLHMENGHFSYPQHEIFSGLDLTLEKSDFLCLLGANGCGKTTLIKCFASMHSLKEGTIQIMGRPLEQLSRRERATLIGYVQQEESVVFPYTVREMVTIGRAPHIGYMGSPSQEDFRIVDDAMERVGVSHLAEANFKTLSGGEKQLVFIARALAQQPRILLMDEPASHLDFRNQNMIMKLAAELAANGIGILMSTHSPDHVFNYATKTALMYQGAFIALGRPRDVLTEQQLSTAYSMDISLFRITDPRTGKEHIFCKA